jgi:hypothetical protein
MGNKFSATVTPTRAWVGRKNPEVWIFRACHAHARGGRPLLPMGNISERVSRPRARYRQPYPLEIRAPVS